METFSALLVIFAGNSPVPGEFPAQRPVTRSFDIFFDLRPNKRLSKQSWGWWFETLSRPLWSQCNDAANREQAINWTNCCEDDSFNYCLQNIFYHNYQFSLIHLNMRSIPANSSKLFLYMSNLNANFDIIRLSETRLTVTSEYINNLDGYHHVPLVRPDHIHSGVSLFISTAINYRIQNEISNK